MSIGIRQNRPSREPSTRALSRVRRSSAFASFEDGANHRQYSRVPFSISASAGSSSVVSREIPARRSGRPEEMAALAAFLCSREADLISGQSIPVNGGYSRHIV